MVTRGRFQHINRQAENHFISRHHIIRSLVCELRHVSSRAQAQQISLKAMPAEFRNYRGTLSAAV